MKSRLDMINNTVIHEVLTHSHTLSHPDSYIHTHTNTHTHTPVLIFTIF